MVKRVIFYLEEERYKRCLAEAAEAVQSFKQYGFDADLWVIEAGEEIPEPDHNTLYLADSKRLLQMLADRGAVYCAYSHEANKGEELKPADYVLSEPQWVDRDSLVKIWQRGRHLPWTILETERCLVREFVPGDLEAICQLYDDEARKYLEAPSQDPEGWASRSRRRRRPARRWMRLSDTFSTGTGAAEGSPGKCARRFWTTALRSWDSRSSALTRKLLTKHRPKY